MIDISRSRSGFPSVGVLPFSDDMPHTFQMVA